MEISYFFYQFLLRVAMVNPKVILDFFVLFLQAMLLPDSIISYALKCPTFFSNQRNLKTEQLTGEAT